MVGEGPLCTYIAAEGCTVCRMLLCEGCLFLSTPLHSCGEPVTSQDSPLIHVEWWHRRVSFLSGRRCLLGVGYTLVVGLGLQVLFLPWLLAGFPAPLSGLVGA